MNSTFTPQNPLFSPANDEELSVLEKHIQQSLLSQLDINITSKRSNKLRDLTCVIAGYSGGYQQIQKHWQNKNEVNTIPDEYASVERIPLEKLGFTDIESIKKIARKDSGLILITGITGSGKTTTARSLSEYICQLRKATYDEPKEFIYDCLPEDNAKLKTIKMSDHDFSKIAKKLMIRKPDVIIVGELRNTSQFDSAVKSAENSLVIATMHASGVEGSKIQMEMFLGRDKLSRTKMAAIIHQSLIRTKNVIKLIESVELDDFSLKNSDFNDRNDLIKTLAIKYDLKKLTSEEIKMHYGDLIFEEVLETIKSKKYWEKRMI